MRGKSSSGQVHELLDFLRKQERKDSAAYHYIAIFNDGHWCLWYTTDMESRVISEGTTIEELRKVVEQEI